MVEQLALAELISSGGLDRHIRRARLRYRRRRDELIAALAEVPACGPGASPPGCTPCSTCRRTARARPRSLAALAADGVAADGLSRYWHRPGPRPSGLVVGFGAPGRARVPGRAGGAGRRAGALLPLTREGRLGAVAHPGRRDRCHTAVSEPGTAGSS